MRLPTFIWTLTYLVWQIREAENRFISGKPLHDLMTMEEMKHFFGVEDVENVPEYDVALPYKATKEGEFASYSLNPHRMKRSLDDNDEDDAVYHYKINFLGKRLHLHVKQNTKFMAPDLQLETRDQEGKPIRRPVSKSTFLTGKVASDPGSLVALSVSDGLTGFVKRSHDSFVVRPLPVHLAQHVRSKEGATPHLVYKSSGQGDVGCQTKTTKRDFIQQQEDNSGKGELVHKYLEVALLADEKIASIHGNKTEEYLLLMASIVNAIFQGVTAGDIKINYVVNRLVLISNEELGVDPSNASVSHIHVIQKLAAWARENNKNDESDPLQFDIASLVRSRGIGGVATVYSKICPRKDLVNVNKDNGLQTAYTIAHETAHNFGLDHDGDGCPNFVNIMSSTLVGGPGALEWSSCSRNELQTFLASNDSSCLDDPPPSARPTPPPSFYTKLPGELEDADTQCKYQFGAGYRRCPQKVSSCDALYCTPDGYTCVSRNLRPLEGTACGLRDWCIKGFCVDNGSPKIDGGWSEWSNYSECSRSCEGGVHYRERTCTNPPAQNGGEPCAGPLKAFWEICNSDVMCPPSQTTFRDQQCQQIDPTFVSYYVQRANPCSLACRSNNTYRFYGNVADGTRCDHTNPYVYDVCIGGQCQAVGCDHFLGSGKLKDRCGVCDGNGDSCAFVKSSYTKNYKKYSYSNVDAIVVLPVNTANAVFEERAATYNLIGVQDENGTNLIPVPSWYGNVEYKAGTKITYTNNGVYPDRLEIEGPTNMTLKIVFVHLYENNVGIDYQYFRPLDANETPEPASCTWVSSNWTDCSTGQQTREVRCVRSDNITGAIYESAANADCCGEESKPDAINLCYNWHASDWQACTKSCGRGSQSKSVVCRAKINATHYKIDQSEALCDAAQKPTAFRYCNEVNCLATWKTSWTECSKICLPGERTRNVKCSRINELGETEDVPDIQCEYEPRPPEITEPCNDDNPCKEYKIGCFRTPAGLFSETLGDFTQESDPDRAVMECKELTRSKNYNVFALGRGGLCMSGPDAQERYHLHKPPAKTTKCSNGIGIGDNSVAYTFDPLTVADLEAVGCYKDKSNRAMPDLYANFRPYKDWNNMNVTILQCAYVARDKGYEYFGVQFYGECYSSVDAAETYDKYGVQTNADLCWANVGGSMTNFVYRIPQLEVQV